MFVIPLFIVYIVLVGSLLPIFVGSITVMSIRIDSGDGGTWIFPIAFFAYQVS